MSSVRRSRFTGGFTAKYVSGWKVPAVLLQKYFDKVTPYGRFYISESSVFPLLLFFSVSYPPTPTSLSPVLFLREVRTKIMYNSLLLG